MNQYKFESGFNIRLLIIGLSVVLLISYGIFNARNLIIGPKIEILSPTSTTETIETSENTISVKGIVKNMSFLSLNGRAISANTEGYFDEKLILSLGMNIIEIKARDRFKNEVQKTIKVYYKEQEEIKI